MKTITINVFEFDELKPEAKEEALSWAKSHFEYPWGVENRRVLDEFCKHFPVKAREGGYRWPSIQPTFSIDAPVYSFTGLRLAAYIWNNYGHILEKPVFLGSLSNRSKFTPVYSKCQKRRDCNLTGYWLDYDILKPLWEFLDRPKDDVSFEELLMQCLEAWFQACRLDRQAFYSEDALSEEMQVIGLDFLENGKKIFRI